MKKIQHILEYLIFLLFFNLFKALPFKLSSFIGAKMALFVGVFVKANKIAEKNLKMAFPQKTDKEIKEIKKDVWDNLGRNVAEFAHISSMKKKEFLNLVEIKNEHYFNDLQNKPFILYSAHFSNWEIISLFTCLKNRKVHMFYRPLNNHYINSAIDKLRKSNIVMYSKGLKGARDSIAQLLKGNILASFIDQKLSEGIKVPFFNKDAMTPPLIANLALKYDFPLVGVVVNRKKNGKYIITFEKPIIVSQKKHLDNNYDIMLHLNKIIEKWIKNSPKEWFWVHNRWKK